MSAFEVLSRFGIWPLGRFALALLAFVFLYLVRVPFVLAASLLADGMEWANRYATVGVPVRSAASGSARAAGGGRR
jgi:hypothetical protein